MTQISYTIYQITNLVNNKVYVGKHKTSNLNDGYMGSGKLLLAAQKKYGIENFKKEILFVFASETEMNNKEKELVTEDFCKQDSTYNLCVGGTGGFGYINDLGKNLIGSMTVCKTQEFSEKMSSIVQKIHSIRNKEHKIEIADKVRKKHKIRYPNGSFYGKNHTDLSKEKIGKANSKLVGNKNSQFGTFWITNGIENKKCKNEIPIGWHKGRSY